MVNAQQKSVSWGLALALNAPMVVLGLVLFGVPSTSPWFFAMGPLLCASIALLVGWQGYQLWQVAPRSRKVVMLLVNAVLSSGIFALIVLWTGRGLGTTSSGAPTGPVEAPDWMGFVYALFIHALITYHLNRRFLRHDGKPGRVWVGLALLYLLGQIVVDTARLG